MTTTSSYHFEYDLHLIKIPPHLDRESIYNLTTITLKAYLSIKASRLSAYVISKTRRVVQRPRGRQLNAKVCGDEGFVILSFFFPSFVNQRMALMCTLSACTKMILQCNVLLIHSVFIVFTKAVLNSRQTAAAVHCVGRHFVICMHAYI